MYSVSIIWMITIWIMITVAKKEERSVIKRSIKKLELISEKKKVSCTIGMEYCNAFNLQRNFVLLDKKTEN